ncbi:MAG: PepSY domain-containing protein [Gammaproteobacteria bacterium]|nr:PepSY domain-containing protein [Gammaproteobacteria bacterium]
MQRLFTLLTLLACLILSVPNQAKENHTVDKQAAALTAMQRFPGKVVSVNPGYQGETPVYRVKVLDDHGGLHTVVIHGQSGEILSAH